MCPKQHFLLLLLISFFLGGGGGCQTEGELGISTRNARMEKESGVTPDLEAPQQTPATKTRGKCFVEDASFSAGQKVGGLVLVWTPCVRGCLLLKPWPGD